MTKLPRVSGREVVSALRKFGYEQDRQRGNHIVLRRTEPPHRRLVVPDHREIASGTLRAILRLAGLTIDESCSRSHKQWPASGSHRIGRGAGPGRPLLGLAVAGATGCTDPLPAV